MRFLCRHNTTAPLLMAPWTCTCSHTYMRVKQTTSPSSRLLLFYQNHISAHNAVHIGNGNLTYSVHTHTHRHTTDTHTQNHTRRSMLLRNIFRSFQRRSCCRLSTVDAEVVVMVIVDDTATKWNTIRNEESNVSACTHGGGKIISRQQNQTNASDCRRPHRRQHRHNKTYRIETIRCTRMYRIAEKTRASR